MSAWLWAAAGAAAALGAPTSVLAGFAAGRASLRPRLAAATTAAATDPLTGVANRAGLLAELDRRVADSSAFAVLLVDLDGFKAVNDRYGHAAGDAVLIEVARRLTNLLGEAGRVARLGGDEFAIVATSPVAVVSKLLGHDVARWIARPVTLDNTVSPDGGTVLVRASVGVVHTWPGEDPRMLLAAADEAMYRAKTSGGVDVVEYDLTLLPGPDVAERRAVRLRDLAQLGRELRTNGPGADATAGGGRR